MQHPDFDLTDAIIVAPDGLSVLPCVDAAQVAHEVRSLEHLYERAGRRPLVWLSLSNGLEVLNHNPELAETAHLARLSSTVCERCDWPAFTRSIPDEFLLAHALGRAQIVVDFGTRKTVPRSFRQGMPYALRQIHRIWHLDVPERSYHLDRQGMTQRDAYEVTAGVDAQLPKRDRSRIAYHRRYLTEAGPGEVALVCAPTVSDGDYNHWVSVAQTAYALGRRG